MPEQDPQEPVPVLMHLPPSTSTKDSLHTIYELQREIAASVFSLQRLLAHLSDLTQSHGEVTVHSSAEICELLEETRNMLIKTQENLQSLTQLLPQQMQKIEEELQGKLTTISSYVQSATDHQDTVSELLPKIEAATDAILEFLDYDADTLRKKDIRTREMLESQERRRRWIVNTLTSALIGLVVSAVATYVLGLSCRQPVQVSAPASHYNGGTSNR